LLSERIDRARGEGRNRLIELREHLLELTQEIDKQMEARSAQAQQLLQAILQEEDTREVAIKYLPAIDEFFIQVLNFELEKSREDGDLDKINKLRTIENVIQEASTTPPEIELIEELLEAADNERMREIFEAHIKEITPEFVDVLSNLVAQTQSSDDARLVDRIQTLYRMAIRTSMEKNL
jgi:hypothetical protein